MRQGHWGLFLGAGITALLGALAPACGGSEGGDTGGAGAACGAGTELCGDACTVTAIDPQNCGACGHACAAGEACQDGACTLACNGGSTRCGDACVDTGTDPANCGSCGHACDAAEEVCAAGQCVPSCGDGGLTKCGGACVDTMTDAAHCGQCGTTCPDGASCVAGQCVTPAPPKGVYTMTNDPAGNKILAFARAADGSLSPSGTFTATGGKGTGAGLGNQHGLVFDGSQNLFFAVNAGDDSVSMLSLEADGGLTLRANVPAGGQHPVSITSHGDVVYVLNAGTAGGAAANITGFTIGGGTLTPIAGSTQPLSTANPSPAQIQFSPDGKALVVTEKGTNMLDTYAVAGGVASAPVTTASSGQTPFGFDFSADMQVIVSEAWGGQMGLSSTSSYALGASGALVPVSPAVATTRTSACWLVVAGSYAYVANATSGDITGFQIAADGTLSLLDADGVTGQAGNAPVDEDVTDDDELLYVVNNGDHSLSIFHINADGSLTKSPDFTGLPSTASGLVAR